MHEVLSPSYYKYIKNKKIVFKNICVEYFVQFECELRNREQEIRDLKLDLRILERKHKTCEDTISGLRVTVNFYIFLYHHYILILVNIKY